MASFSIVEHFDVLEQIGFGFLSCPIVKSIGPPVSVFLVQCNRLLRAHLGPQIQSLVSTFPAQKQSTAVIDLLQELLLYGVFLPAVVCPILMQTETGQHQRCLFGAALPS